MLSLRPRPTRGGRIYNVYSEQSYSLCMLRVRKGAASTRQLGILLGRRYPLRVLLRVVKPPYDNITLGCLAYVLRVLLDLVRKERETCCALNSVHYSM